MIRVLYFGDFDPSGEDMVRSLRERLRNLGSRPDIIKSALVFEDIERYRLPPDFTKATDTRRSAFVARYRPYGGWGVGWYYPPSYWRGAPPPWGWGNP